MHEWCCRCDGPCRHYGEKYHRGYKPRRLDPNIVKEIVTKLHLDGLRYIWISPDESSIEVMYKDGTEENYDLKIRTVTTVTVS